MATRMVLPYEQQKIEQQILRQGKWGSMVGTESNWVASKKRQSDNTWSKKIASAGSNKDTDSWEIRAFAEDASSIGQWPPRSYSCTFCKREFRTAQALGGHMNVHKKEKAHAYKLAQQLTNTASVSPISQISAAQSGNESQRIAWVHSIHSPGFSLPSSEISLEKSSQIRSTSDLLRGYAVCSQLGSRSGGGSTCVRSQNSPLSTSPPASQESISSTSAVITREQSPTIIENRSLMFGPLHPYGRSSRHGDNSQGVNLSRFSPCFSKAMSDQTDTLDLELRLGQSPCEV